MLVIRMCLSLLWLVVAIAKAANPDGFFRWMASLSGLGALAVGLLGWGLIAAEAVLGGAVALSWIGGGKSARAVAAASWIAAAAAACVTLATRRHGECGCFGALVPANAGTRLIVAGAIMWLSYEMFGHAGRPGQRSPRPRHSKSSEGGAT